MTGRQRRPHLLLFGWYCEGTGFTRVLRALIGPLAQDYRVTWMGVGYRGRPRELAEGVLVRPTNLEGGDLVGAHAARLEWERLQPDLILALNDVWYLEHYPREFGRRTEAVPMYGYLPLDGDIPDPSLVQGLAGFRKLFTYTRHAADQLRTALDQCGIPIPVGMAGHGVDLESFAPLPAVGEALDVRARMNLAAELFELDQPAWVVLNASRPDPRKRIDLSIQGFACFARNKPANVRLCLHQAVAHERFVSPLIEQVRALGIEDRVLWWPKSGRPLDDRTLNQLYNACAVGLNTSLGEGFGLVSFEHAATGAPQLLPAHASMLELWGDSALLMRPVRPYRSEYSPLIMGAVDSVTVADALESLYADASLYRHLSIAGRLRSQQPDLSWASVARQLLVGLQGD